MEIVINLHLNHTSALPKMARQQEVEQKPRKDGDRLPTAAATIEMETDMLKLFIGLGIPYFGVVGCCRG